MGQKPHEGFKRRFKTDSFEPLGHAVKQLDELCQFPLA
jgi:hypothetical protein